MSWILIGVIFTLAHTSRHRTTFDRIISTNGLAVDASPVPPNAPFLKPINPYIKHWEAAHFDAKIIATARHQHEIRRRKRHANSTIAHDAATTATSSSANTIKFQFFAHNREFRVLLREDPHSIFSPNVEIENTDGPIHYDVSRVYSGTLEDHDDSIVHGILTENNLFDGSIITPTENYYIEPASRYSSELIDNGIHTIVYKTSDVHMLPHQKSSSTDPTMEKHYCASQRLHEKMQKIRNNKQQLYDALDIELSDKNTINEPVPSEHLSRSKRWLADELLESRDPPLPIDLDAPYNDEFTVFSRKYNKDHNTAGKTDEPWRNILITSYNAKNDYASRNLSKNHPNATTTGGGGDHGEERGQYREPTRILNTTYSRPSHKTHVEIITKNGATRKPNIIGSNYNPELIITRNNFHHHQHHSNINNNIHSNSIDAKSTYDRKSTCMLYLQADHTFFEKLGSEEASIEAITRHVQRANTIYKNTDFNGDGKADNITFMIKRIKIHTSNALKDTNYRFPGNYGVEKFLELFSEEDYDAFCLAYMFTYRDFEMGTLGLAWTGDLKNAGGVCEKNGHYRGSLKSLNTGIVTLLNYGKHVPPAVSHVTLAHEIGHNFGSPHDPELCTPGGEDGNFIMFARATSGDKKNNNKFSPCSLKAIEPVLNSKARSSKGCFTEPQQAICGNGVVDPGEECDCGWEEDCKDSCCYPMSTNPSIDEKPCTLTPRSHCSPSQGPCCTTSCTLKFGDKCRDDNGCRDPSFCNGQMANCPPSVNKANKTICNKEFVCFMGDCTGSICLAYGLESCQCIPTVNDPKTKACELCCKLPGEGNPCKSSFEWNDKPYDVPDMYSKPGTPCNDYNGYCDVFQKCREVDPAGPLATLRRLLLSEESIESFKNWVMSNWFVVALIISGIISILILSMRLFGKEINRKSKSVTIIHSATTETVRLPDDSNGVIVHAAIRTKVPLKKKVRGERSKTKRSSGLKNAESSSKNVEKTTTTAGVTTAAAVPTTSNSRSKTLKRSIEKHTKKIRSRKTTSDGTRTEGKTSKNPLASTMAKVKSSRSKTKSSTSKAKEILNYTQRASADEDKLNAFGKVHQWLLDSPTTTTSTTVAATQATSALQELDQLDKTRPICKSQSQTHNLSSTQRSPKKVKSLSNLQEKVKLQVVYKPPFKLSLKLSKNSAVQTRPVVNSNSADVSRNRRAARVDKARKTSGLTEKKKPRTALLLQSKSGRDVDDHGFRLKSNHRRTEDRQQLMPAERKQDTLELKAEQQSGGSGGSNSNGRGAINDEKKLIETNPVNTDTFKISKTSSGTKLLSNSSSALNEIDNPPSSMLCMMGGGGDSKTSNVGHRNSFINNIRNSGIDYMAAVASAAPASATYAPQNRSSTSNLTKDLHKITRSSTTNLSKNQSHRNSFDVKQHNFHDVNRSNSTHNFSKSDRLSETMHSNLLKQPSHTRSSKTNLNNSENGTLPSSTVSSTSSTNTNTNSITNMNAIDS